MKSPTISVSFNTALDNCNYDDKNNQGTDEIKNRIFSHEFSENFNPKISGIPLIKAQAIYFAEMANIKGIDVALSVLTEKLMYTNYQKIERYRRPLPEVKHIIDRLKEWIKKYDIPFKNPELRACALMALEERTYESIRDAFEDAEKKMMLAKKQKDERFIKNMADILLDDESRAEEKKRGFDFL